MAKLQDKFFNRVIEGELQAEEEIKSVIQADKDILSQIETSYNSQTGTTTFTFPEGVLPVKFYLNGGSIESDVYCDYRNYELVDDDGTSIGTCQVANKNVKISITGGLSDYTITGFLFVHFSNDDGDNYANWYNILNPEIVNANPTLAGTESALEGLQVGVTKYKVSGGTKLYKHDLQDASGHTVRLVSTVSTALCNLTNGRIPYADYNTLVANPLNITSSNHMYRFNHLGYPDAFVLQYSSDNGSTWTSITTWAQEDINPL